MLWVVLVTVAGALFGVVPRTADTQTIPTYYEVQALGVPPGSTAVEPNSIPYDINDFGYVVGEANVSGSTEGMNSIAHAFLYKDGQMKDLGTLGDAYSRANDINESGQVVGWSYDITGQGRTFLWTDDGDPNTVDMKDPGTLGGPFSVARATNNSGLVVGLGEYNSSRYYHGFLYRDEGPMQDLGVLASRENRLSWANDINDLNQIVGYSDNDYSGTNYNRAFLYQNEEMIDLGTRLYPDNNGNVWNLGSANGINNKGRGAREDVLYGDYYEEMAKVRMETAVGDHQRENSWSEYGVLVTRLATKERSH